MAAWDRAHASRVTNHLYATNDWYMMYYCVNGANQDQASD